MKVIKDFKLDKDGIKIEEAIRLISKHLPDGKDEIKPTLLHCIRVGTYLYNNNYSKEIVLAGYLHDILEDSNVSPVMIKDQFGTNVLQIIINNSKDKISQKISERVL